MSLINITDLTFGYDGSSENVFENVSLQIDTDWKLGFTGRNGRGKTTLLNLLLGRYEYSGKISSSVSFDYFPFQVDSPESDTLSIISELCPDYEYWKLVREMTLLEVGEDVLYRSFETLSKGEQTKVLLSALFLKEGSFLLIDEPTNHLDMHGRDVVSRYLSRKKGFILVSHDMAFIDQSVDHIMAINKTNIEVVQGNFSGWYHNKELKDSFEAAENDKLRKTIKRLEQSGRQKSDWSFRVENTINGSKVSGIKPDKGFVSHKSAKMMKRSKTLERRRQSAIEEKSKLLKDVESSDELKLDPVMWDGGDILTFDDVAVSYDGNCILSGFSLTVQPGDRVAVCGKNGSGKSSLLRLVLGEDISYTGQIHMKKRLRISYVSQDTSYLRGTLEDFAADSKIDETRFKTVLRKLDFSRVQLNRPMESYSEGQKKKVLIARSLCEAAHLYIWDEPLNYVDIISRIQIEELIVKFKPTILFVEHDRIFCETVATKEAEI